MAEKSSFEPSMLPEMLPLYYRRLFPFDPFYRWLSYGNVDSRDFSNREFSFTLHDDIYIRYQSFNNQAEMEEAIKKRSPHKIDIGAIFSYPPVNHKQWASQMVPLMRELVFDVDLTDYDEVRTCCQGADVCPKCWKLMSLACRILDSALRDDFGFKHLLWVFSGRRGIHCWVCDKEARLLTGAERSAVAEYLQLITGGSNYAKKVNLPNTDKLHSSIRRATDIIKNQFVEVCVIGQGLFQKPESYKKLLSLITDERLKLRIQTNLKGCSDDREKWQVFVNEIKKQFLLLRVKKLERLTRFDEDIPDVSPFTIAKALRNVRRKILWYSVTVCDCPLTMPLSVVKGETPGRFSSNGDDGTRRKQYLLEEIMIQYAYPRLDINVTKGLNHLLKSPFCIHPKTGKICVPFNPKTVDKFNPMTVPTIDHLIEEINSFDVELKKYLTEEEINKTRVKDYRKTSLNKSIQVFEEFVRKLEESWCSDLATNDTPMAF